MFGLVWSLAVCQSGWRHIRLTENVFNLMKPLFEFGRKLSGTHAHRGSFIGEMKTICSTHRNSRLLLEAHNISAVQIQTSNRHFFFFFFLKKTLLVQTLLIPCNWKMEAMVEERIFVRSFPVVFFPSSRPTACPRAGVVSMDTGTIPTIACWFLVRSLMKESLGITRDGKKKKRANTFL